MDDKQALIRYIGMFGRSVKALEECKAHLQQYNRLLAKVMQRSRWQDQIYLQAAMSLLRDVEGDIRTGQVYLAFLQYAQQHWGQQKNIDSQLSRLGNMVKRLNKTSVEAKAREILEQDRRRKVAHVMLESQRNYVEIHRQHKQRRRVGTGLLATGSVIAVLGGAAVIAGSVLLWEGQQSNSPFSPGEKQQRNDAGLGLAIGGSVVLVGGGLLAIVGALMRPSAEAAERSTIENHNNHLRWERDHPLPRIPSGQFHLFLPEMELMFSQ
jgi:hypothetical protein